jgi:uncharacterized membrane protein
MTGAPAALVAAIVLQFVWIGIGLANWDPYAFVFLLTCSNVIQLILIFVIAVPQRQLSLHDELRAEADHGAISRLLYHREAQELLLVRLAEKLDADARDLRPILSTLAGKTTRPESVSRASGRRRLTLQLNSRRADDNRACEAGSRLQPERMCPRAASGRMRSQTIFVVARIGAERIAPGTPRSQNQNTKEKTTRTGLSVNRLARSIGVTVSPSITWVAP